MGFSVQAKQTVLFDKSLSVQWSVDLLRATSCYAPDCGRKSEADHPETQPVNVSVLGNVGKMVTSSQRFEFIQTHAVSERVLARTVVVSLRDGDTPISDEQTLMFDSTSQLLDERKRSVFLTVHLAEYRREMRKYSFADAINKWFKLGNNLNQRDTIAVRRTTFGRCDCARRSDRHAGGGGRI